MRSLARSDGDIYLPNVAPMGPVNFVFLCMEPSLGRWASSAEEAERKIASGFRNFLDSPDDMVLHYAIREYLCRGDLTYHITDISKGAMLVEKARGDRQARYARWHKLLEREIALVARQDARFFAVGKEVGRHLELHRFLHRYDVILHYSSLAAKARNDGIRGHEQEFESFRATLHHEDFVRTATLVLRESALPSEMQDAILQRIKKAGLSASRVKLLFNYKAAFCNANAAE